MRNMVPIVLEKEFHVENVPVYVVSRNHVGGERVDHDSRVPTREYQHLLRVVDAYSDCGDQYNVVVTFSERPYPNGKFMQELVSVHITENRVKTRR